MDLNLRGCMRMFQNRQQKRHQGGQSGFTLVEMAVVLMVIGLLVGGVIRGQEMAENAEVMATIRQEQSYMAATNAFQDAYGSLPGDMPDATNRIPNCNAAYFCDNGNGNARIGNIVASGPSTPGTFDIMVNQAGNINRPQVETSYFWKHLAMGKFISGIDINGDPATPIAGRTHPIAKVPGVFIVFYSNFVGDVGVGHNIRLQRDVRATASVAGQLPLRPAQARNIDLKLDDGMPDLGGVTADYEGTNCDPGGVYSNSDTRNCNVQFSMR